MPVIRSSDFQFVPASHENLLEPSALKKVLLSKSDLPPGRLQMFNLAKVPAGKAFSKHLHEDMTEVFFILSGQAVMTTEFESTSLGPNDLFIVPPKTVHSMRAGNESDVDYIVFGLSSEQGGKTVVIE